MSRSVRLHTAAQFREVKTLAGLVAERSDLPPAERHMLTACQADRAQAIREDRCRAAGAGRLPVPQS